MFRVKPLMSVLTLSLAAGSALVGAQSDPPVATFAARASTVFLARIESAETLDPHGGHVGGVAVHVGVIRVLKGLSLIHI